MTALAAMVIAAGASAEKAMAQNNNNQPVMAPLNAPQEVEALKPLSPPVSSRSSRLPSGIAQLPGLAFIGNAYEHPQIEHDMQILPHYGITTAVLELKEEAVHAKLYFKPRPNNESFPVVSVLIERVQGGRPVRFYIMRNEPVLNDDVIEKTVIMPAGRYNVSVEFYKSTKPDRSHLEIHGIVFD
ncbi:MAG: hypothetical protein WCK47_11060 [bacterium]|nr:hypothetical protein [Candidatus Sumerlaeota bacterium]